MNLFTIAQELRQLSERLEDESLAGETDAKTHARISELSLAADAKIRGVVGLIREYEAEGGAIADQAKRLADLAASKRGHARRLKEWLRLFLETTGTTRITTDLGDVRVQKSPLRVELTGDAADADEAFQKWTVAPDKAAVLDVYRRTGCVPHGFKIEQDTHIRII